MKAPDIVESWKWKPAETIIERLLAESACAILPRPMLVIHLDPKPPRDRHYFAWRRCQAIREARKELARLMGRG